MSECAADDCSRDAVSKGYCDRHYRQVRRNGEPKTRRNVVAPPCKVDGCDRKSDAKGYCPTHYMRWRKYGDPLTAPRLDHPDTCTIDGCGEPFHAKGWCERHYMLNRYHGTPTPEPVEYVPGPGSVDVAGYRRLSVRGQMILEHRYVMAQHLGPRPIATRERPPHQRRQARQSA